jgi:pSer/pThr/pTyr-binding forkhead associated (FHA) protein
MSRQEQATARAQSPSELKAELEAEREGHPFVVFRDSNGHQVISRLDETKPDLIIGRSSDADLNLAFDGEVSRLHARLTRLGRHWILADEGLSRNGSFVNGQRVTGQHRLRDRDVLRFGETVVRYRQP